MKSLLVNVLFVLSAPVMADRVSLKGSDPATDLLFSQLGNFRTTPNETQGLAATESALEALLADLAPQIRHLHDYIGIFTANCSVYFNDAIEQADCDVHPAHARSLTAGAEFVPSSRLSEQYRHPITQSNILLSNIFADWTDGKTQEFTSDLYFRQGTCSNSFSQTASLTPTKSYTPTKTLLKTQSRSSSITLPITGSQTSFTRSLSPSLALVRSLSLSLSSSKSLLETLSSILSPTKTETLSASREHPQTPSVSVSSTKAHILSQTIISSSSFSETSSRTETITGTERLRQTRSLTPSLSGSRELLSSPSQTHSQLMTRTPTRAPTCPPAPPVLGLLAAWNQTGGTYQDGTSQPSRYSILNTVVTDALTGMQWQQTASTSPMDWTAAATYCSEQTMGGLSGWRVPNIGELGTLLDWTIANPTVPINAGAFPGTPATVFWASSPVIGEAGYSWDVRFGNLGQSYWDPVATLDNVRCVRSCYLLRPT